MHHRARLAITVVAAALAIAVLATDELEPSAPVDIATAVQSHDAGRSASRSTEQVRYDDIDVELLATYLVEDGVLQADGETRSGGELPPASVLLAASGAAFAAVVIGQVANAFACRSTVHWPGALGWASNRFLLWAVAVELLLLAGFLFIPLVAAVLVILGLYFHAQRMEALRRERRELGEELRSLNDFIHRR